MNLEVGMYVRTKWGVAKISEIYGKVIYVNTCFMPIDETKCYKEDIIKASFNLIDLIEIGDVVLDEEGHKYEVYAIGSDCVYINGMEEFMKTETIKGILIKEQFENMSYKVGN